jgi:hypothetical protein
MQLDRLTSEQIRKHTMIQGMQPSYEIMYCSPEHQRKMDKRMVKRLRQEQEWCAEAAKKYEESRQKKLADLPICPYCDKFQSCKDNLLMHIR